MENKRDILTNLFLEAGISLSEKQADLFLCYAALLEEWNQKMNLTAITAFEEVMQKHFIDSVYPFVLSEVNPVQTLLDMGSGAGFPGIPLKILFPELKITLADALNKRIIFLKEVISRLELTKIEAIHTRAEDLGKKSQFREQFDIVTARAVAPLNILAEYCLPFVRIGGVFLAYKSEKVEEELKTAQNALKALGAEEQKPYYYCLPGTETGRSLLVYRKTQKTPLSYPRKAGTITKKPL